MNDIIYWLAATQLPGIGPMRLSRWLEHFSSMKNLFTASTADLQLAGLTPLQISAIKTPDWKAAEKTLDWCEKNHTQIITQRHEKYPLLLKEAVGSPILLYVQGDASLLSSPQLAMVGSRNPSATGAETAHQFAGHLSAAGLVITSGLALGIDAASHRGVLASQQKTIAVIGTGLNYIYPSAHRQLAEEILASGAIVSEFSPFTPPKAKNFPLRNRIISGLSLGVFVVEAALKSGSLITAQYAVEQNREVFALPGSIHNPLSRGCHQLIQKGAKLVEKSTDILEELQILHCVSSKKDNERSPAFLKFIGWEPTSIDTIIMRSGLTPAEVSSMLLSLELEGYVRVEPGGYMRLTK